MLDRRSHIFRPSRAQDNAVTERSREIIAQSFELLKRTAQPDTFLGRQTFEPFEEEDDNP
ncbi:hypothetical protein [Bradyrhizobium cenepequi]